MDRMDPEKTKCIQCQHPAAIASIYGGVEMGPWASFLVGGMGLWGAHGGQSVGTQGINLRLGGTPVDPMWGPMPMVATQWGHVAPVPRWGPGAIGNNKK